MMSTQVFKIMLLLSVAESTEFKRKISVIREWLDTHMKIEGINHVILVADFPRQENMDYIQEFSFILNKYGKSFTLSYLMFNRISLHNILRQKNDVKYLVIGQQTKIFDIFLNNYSSDYLIQNNWLLFLDKLSSWDRFENIRGLRQNSRFYVYEAQRGIFEVYRPHRRAPIVSNMLYDSKLKSVSSNSLHDRRRDLQGLKLRVGYIFTDNFNPIHRKGTWYQLFATLSSNLNITIEYIRSYDNAFGSTVTNGKFNGVVGLVQNMSVDLSPLDFTVSESRAEVVDFSFSLGENNIYLYYNSANLQNFKWSSYAQIFSIEFWYYLLAFLFLAILCLYAILKILTLYCKDEEIGAFQVFFIVYFCFLGRDTIIQDPKRASKRILFITVSLFGALVSWSYHANLISMLTSSDVEMPINSLGEILNNRDYKLLLNYGSALSDDFKKANQNRDPIKYKIYHEIIKNNENDSILSFKEIKKRLLSEEKVIVLAVDDYDNMECAIKKVNIHDGIRHLAWIYKKEFEYRDLFNHQIILMNQYGIRSSIIKKTHFETDKNKCNPLNENSYSEIRLQSILMVFLILSLGIYSSIIIFFVERLWNYLLNPGKKKLRFLKNKK